MHLQLKDPALWRQKAYINGQWRHARSEGTLQIANPASRQPLGTVPSCDGIDTRDAIEAANVALPAWGSLTAQQRATLLMKWHDLMLEHADDLALLMTLEHKESR